MKVPIQYESSDRYNAGVDVVYDDESKLQYAPFIYATTASGDNGSDGEDEEGEDTMVVHTVTSTSPVSLDKTWTEINNAIGEGKTVMIVGQVGDGILVEYVASLYMIDEETNYYIVDTLCLTTDGKPSTNRYISETSDGVLQFDVSGYDGGSE